MDKLLLMSVVIASLVIPLRIADEPTPRRAVRKLLVYTLMFNFVYLLALRFIYPLL